LVFAIAVPPSSLNAVPDLGDTKTQVCELKPQVKAIRTAASVRAREPKNSEIRSPDRSSNAFQFKIATLIPMLSI
jgi:hypothetical protein